MLAKSVVGFVWGLRWRLGRDGQTLCRNRLRWPAAITKGRSVKCLAHDSGPYCFNAEAPFLLKWFVLPMVCQLREHLLAPRQLRVVRRKFTIHIKSSGGRHSPLVPTIPGCPCGATEALDWGQSFEKTPRGIRSLSTTAAISTRCHRRGRRRSIQSTAPDAAFAWATAGSPTARRERAAASPAAACR